MDIVPLTLVISLCLTFTFIVFFAREQARRRFGSSESEALLPLLEENTRPASAKDEPVVIDFSKPRRKRCEHRHACSRGDNCEHR